MIVRILGMNSVEQRISALYHFTALLHLREIAVDATKQF